MRMLLVASLFLLFYFQTSTSYSSPADTSLKDYLDQPEHAFAWKIVAQSTQGQAKISQIELTSQVWMDITWKHVLMVYEPAELEHKDHVLLFITGGGSLNKPDSGEQLLGLLLAQLCKARVAMLHQVPNQPLLGGLREDNLITETLLFQQASGDKRWPLLFPMVKSAVRAMDCIGQLADKEWGQPVKGFVVSGASKRGWTTWLVGAFDRRIQGIAPMVIDTLNFPKQMNYQLETWGRYSEQIEDYERKGLMKRLKDDPNSPVWQSVDPWYYREKLTLPKLIINGTNDRYWTVDALNNYFDDLSGPKHIRYVPNAGHNLRGASGSQEAALTTLAVFFHHTVEQKTLPTLEWRHLTDGKTYQLKIESSVTPTSVLIWSATSLTKDFREARWTSQSLQESNGSYLGEIDKPQSGHVALYGEVFYRSHGLDYSLSTQIRRE